MNCVNPNPDGICLIEENNSGISDYYCVNSNMKVQ